MAGLMVARIFANQITVLPITYVGGDFNTYCTHVLHYLWTH